MSHPLVLVVLILAVSGTNAMTNAPDELSSDMSTDANIHFPERLVVEIPLTEPAGGISWRGGEDTTEISWTISLNSSSGIQLTLEEIDLDPERGESLSVCLGPLNESCSEELQKWTGHVPAISVFSASQFTIPASILFVPSNEAFVRVIVEGREAPEDGDRRGEWERKLPRIAFHYQAVAMDTLPPRLENGRYDCSPPHEIPAEWRCDLVRQCEDGEDEENFPCPYNANCPMGIVGFKRNCLNFNFPAYSSSVAEAKKACSRRTSLRELLSPQDPEVIELVARVTSLNGYEGLIVEVSRVEVHTSGTEHLYRFLWQWGTYGHGHSHQVIYGQPDPRLDDALYECGVLRTTPHLHLQPVSCSKQHSYPFVCSDSSRVLVIYPSVVLPRASRVPGRKFPTKQCHDGSHVQLFYSCPSHVVRQSEETSEETSSKPGSGIPDTFRNLPKLECKNGVQVDYSLTCDAHDDCGDETDEETCSLVSSIYATSFICKRNPEVISADLVCDGVPHCLDGTDESRCSECQSSSVLCEGISCVPESYMHTDLCPQENHIRHDNSTYFQPILLNYSTASFLSESDRYLIDLDGYGLAKAMMISNDQPCPEGYFQCEKSLCIPVYLVNNGQVDCPFDDYDTQGDLYREIYCPGYYRCHGHEICLHDDHLCDGVPQCPLKDDERYCHLTCPPGCTCQGRTVTCQQFAPEEVPSSRWIPYWTRYLDVSGVVVPEAWLDNLQHLWYLQFLNLSSCGLQDLQLWYVYHVRVLDVSFNQLTNISSILITSLTQLTHLNLSYNHLQPVLETHFGDFKFENAAGLISLELRNTSVQEISPGSFIGFTSLRYLDIRDNAIRQITKGMFRGLRKLRDLYTDSQKVCCAFSDHHPISNARCHAPADELSSCDDLLRSDFFRGFLWTLAALAVTGNVGVLVYRLFLESVGTSPGFRVLVANLCFSDFLMGVYLVIIGSADASFKGQYLWEQDTWTHSAACTAAGYLSLTSSEVSALIVCLITLDRLMMLQFPLKPHLHLQLRHIITACVVIWVIGATLAAVPLLPGTVHWEFYSQTGICLPLPITQQDFPGQEYAFGVFIVLNFGLFLLIGSGQLLIYRAIRSGRMSGSSRRQQQDMAIARRLFLIVFSDFCCWFPIGVLGLLAIQGTPIPGVLNVWAAIFVLPLNSALNPFLYTLGTLLERRRKRREAERVQTMLAKLHVQITTWPQDSLQQLLQHVQRALKTVTGHAGDVTAVAGSGVTVKREELNAVEYGRDEMTSDALSSNGIITHISEVSCETVEDGL